MKEKRYTVAVTYPSHMCENDDPADFQEILIVNESQMKLLNYLRETDLLMVKMYVEPEIENLAD